MNTKTTKQAAPTNATKAASATSGKHSQPAGVASGMENEPAPRVEPAGRKRRKPFVL